MFINLILHVMNIHNLKTVACYNSRLLLRSWMFRLFLLLLFLIIILYQVLAQTNIFYGINSGLVTLSSYFPQSVHDFANRTLDFSSGDLSWKGEEDGFDGHGLLSSGE